MSLMPAYVCKCIERQQLSSPTQYPIDMLPPTPHFYCFQSNHSQCHPRYFPMDSCRHTFKTDYGSSPGSKKMDLILRDSGVISVLCSRSKVRSNASVSGCWRSIGADCVFGTLSGCSKIPNISGSASDWPSGPSLIVHPFPTICTFIPELLINSNLIASSVPVSLWILKCVLSWWYGYAIFP